MDLKSIPKHVSLSRVEMIAYWVLSLGSHLYSFYHLHKFSKEHEIGLDREDLLEKGTLLNWYKKDPNDFEWSFWSDWAKKSLLWTLTGHAVVSKLANTIVPEFRIVVLSVYGVLAACSVLGLKGLAVVLTHLGLSFGVAQLQRPAVTWCCTTLLLLTLHVPALRVLQRSWYDTEEEYYLLLFSLAVCGLRFVSFSLEHAWRPHQAGGLAQLGWLVAYSFYHPLFYNGPIILYNDYLQQMQRAPESSVSGWKTLLWMSRAGRMFLWWLIAEYMIHTMYMHCIQANQTYLEMLPPWALGGLALALVQFFYVKYMVLFGLPSMLATLDGLTPPKLPRCVSITYSFTGMWRYFDEGLYRWLIRYIYVPLGGSRNGPLRKVLSTGLAFGFVCLWHGGHDYLRYWALMNWAGVLLENATKTLLTSSFISSITESRLSATARRRCTALLHAFSTAMLILSNLVFLGGTHVGLVFWERVFVRGWCTVAPPMLAFLYCFAQIGMEWIPETC